jgi:carbon storage regulator
MLVITRRVGETIVIDGNIRVTVLVGKGGKIRLGVTAPDSVCVDREEIHERRVQGKLTEWDAGLQERRMVPVHA